MHYLLLYSTKSILHPKALHIFPSISMLTLYRPCSIFVMFEAVTPHNSASFRIDKPLFCLISATRFPILSLPIIPTILKIPHP